MSNRCQEQIAALPSEGASAAAPSTRDHWELLEGTLRAVAWTAGICA